MDSYFSVSACAARGTVRWVHTDQRYTNFDAVFFFCLLGVPLFPVRVVHAFQHMPAGLFGRGFEWSPIRWSLDTLFLAWGRRASLGADVELLNAATGEGTVAVTAAAVRAAYPGLVPELFGDAAVALYYPILSP